jgi:hypothetical protein
VLASTVGFAVGVLMAGCAVFFVTKGNPGPDTFASNAALGTVLGASTGTAQWLVLLVLQRQVSRSGWWVLASTLGGAVGLAVGSEVAEGLVGAASYAVIGASVGTAQWLVLRRHVSRSGWWVLASTVGLAAGGAITGGVMVWLLRQPVTEESSLSQEAP